MIIAVIAFVFALLLALLLVPIFASMAPHVGLIDLPDNNRKLHRDAIPMVGGLTLFVAGSIVVFLTVFLGERHSELLRAWTQQLSQWIPLNRFPAGFTVSQDDIYELAGLFIGAFALLCVGLADDRFNIRGRQKLLGQIGAVTILVLFGYQFTEVSFAGIEIDFGIFSILVVYAWVLAAINSVNLLDGADGIASTIGIIMALAICIMSMVSGKIVDAVIAATIAGALLGFLKYNFPPAKAYLGDSGSMLIGFLLSALAIRSMFKQPSAYAFFAPVALLAIPFIDTGAAIVRRRMMGRSIFAVDRGHLHHSLMKQGYSPRTALLWVALLCTTTAAGAIMSLIHRQSEYALVSIGIVLAVMFASKIFGIAELQLVSGKATTVAKGFLRLNAQKPDASEFMESLVHVQGSLDWNETWEMVCQFADRHQLNQITLDLNAPWLHESFHASRRRKDADRGENMEWFALIPLVVQGRAFGRLEIRGAHDLENPHRQTIENLLQITENIEQTLFDSSVDPSVDPSDNPSEPASLPEIDEPECSAVQSSQADPDPAPAPPEKSAGTSF